jgi:hypothetical protein
MKADDSPLAWVIRAAQWMFLGSLLLFCFGHWMDSSRNGVDRSHVSTWKACWIAFLILIGTIELAVARILEALERRDKVEPSSETRSIRALDLKGKD